MSRIGKRAVSVPTGVTVNLAGQNIAVKGPKGELKFVLVEHVLANAIAYSESNGKIALQAEGDDTKVVIRITDNGAGIADKELPQVFDRFHRIDEAGVRGEAALGLGLPLTQQFIEAHGGTVEIKSKKGKGTSAPF